MKSLFVAVVAFAAAIGAGATPVAQGTVGAPSGIPAQKSTVLQRIVVRVNGEIFTQTELEFRQIQALRDQDRQVRRAEDLNTDPGLRAALAQVTPAILVDAVDELILAQHGREAKLTYTDAQFTRSVEDLKKANKLDDKTFPEALKQEGMTLADLRVNFERSWLIQTTLQRELSRNMSLTEEEARRYYNAHPDEFMKPATVTLREILINVPSEKAGAQGLFNAATADSVKERITAIRERAIKGEDFAALVAEVSDSGTKANGGVIGPVNTADISPALVEILDKMKPGDITEPLRTKAGYQILKLEARSVSEPETFEKSRDAISMKILDSRVGVERTKFLQKLLTQAVIEWKDEALKKMYETERAARLKSGEKDAK